MMNWAMEWVSSEGSRWGVDVSEWSHAQNKQFEDALAVYDRDTPDRWQKVAAMIPGKSVADVTRHYQELEDDVSMIEAGLLPVCEYEDDDDGKRPAGARRSEQERKKGVPWTEEEHKLFLMGLKKHGKGDWRNISRNFVVTRTPTQVASHAQKYFLRQVSGAKDKRRASIHDITTSTLDSLQPSSAPHPLAYGPYHGRIGYHHNHNHTMEY